MTAGDGTQSAALAAGKAQAGELENLQLQVNRLKSAITPGQSAQQRLRKACNDFEAVFISKLWEQMRATVPKDGLLHSQQEEMYQSMFDRDFAEKMASDGGIGLGDMMYAQLKDKIKNTKTVTGRTGLNTPAAAKAQANADAQTSAAAQTNAVATNASGRTDRAHHHKGRLGAIDSTATSQLRKPEGKLDRAILHALDPARYQTASATGLSGAAGGMAPSATPGLSSPRASAGIAAKASASAHGAKAPSPPASVSGEVMPEVDALAQRIVEDYDHKLRVDGVHPDQLSRRRAAAETMQAAAAYRKSSGQDGRDGRERSAGRKLATIG